MTTKPILVLGGTGKTGRHVASLLQQHGHPTKVASRNGTTRFDWNDQNTWEPALEGAGAAYLVDSQQADAAASLSSFSKLAVSHGLHKLVLLSVRDWIAPPGEEKLPTERAVRESGAEWTILKPAWFAQNFSEDPFFLSQVLDGDIVTSTGDGVEPFIDTRDIAEVAVAALTGNGHAGKAYELSGPELLSLQNITDQIANATGRNITHRPVTPEDFTTYATERGVPEDFTALLNMLYSWISRGDFAQLGDGVQQVLGRPPRSFTEYVNTTATTGIWHP